MKYDHHIVENFEISAKTLYKFNCSIIYFQIFPSIPWELTPFFNTIISDFGEGKWERSGLPPLMLLKAYLFHIITDLLFFTSAFEVLCLTMPSTIIKASSLYLRLILHIFLLFTKYFDNMFSTQTSDFTELSSYNTRILPTMGLLSLFL